MFSNENFQPPFSIYECLNPSINEKEYCNMKMDIVDTNYNDLSSVFGMPEDDSCVSFSIPSLSSADFVNFDQVDITLLDSSLPNDHLALDFEELGPILNGEMDDISQFFQSGQSFDAMSTYPAIMDVECIQPLSSFPIDEMEIDNTAILLHLVMAYSEAIDQDQTELADVVAKRVLEKVNPVGQLTGRLLYYMFQTIDKQSDYLKQEAYKNFHAAFKAFYQVFPYGKFAHFTANCAILDAMPRDAKVIHIIDYDMGDGTQWSSMIEAVGYQSREIRITSMKLSMPSQWDFEETKKRLYDHAKPFGLNLKVDEMEMQDLMRMKNRDDNKAWLAFNVTSNLPHMGRMRSSQDVLEFLDLAKEILTIRKSEKGVLTFCNGDACERFNGCSNFTSYLDNNLVHYQALLDSIECNFPCHLGEARTAMECLFVSPFVSSLEWVRRWEMVKEKGDVKSLGFGMKGLRLSKESLMEAKELVSEGYDCSSYQVRVEGDDQNEMVLEWRGVGLVRVSCWTTLG